MTRERFSQIKAAAMRLCDEIEFADFVDVNVAALLEWHNLFARMVRNADFLTLLKRDLGALFDACEQQYQAFSGDKDVQLVAAAIVQYALRSLLINTFPAMAPMAAYRLRTKFLHIAEPLILGAGDSRVPNFSGQQTGGDA